MKKNTEFVISIFAYIIVIMAKIIQNILLVTVQYLLIFTSPNFFFAGQVNSFRFQTYLYGRIKLQEKIRK